MDSVKCYILNSYATFETVLTKIVYRSRILDFIRALVLSVCSKFSMLREVIKYSNNYFVKYR